MSQEIERKFLVHEKLWAQLTKPEGTKIIQSYLSSNPEKVVRIRIFGAIGFLTIKGKTSGITRKEFEYEIPFKDAEEMIVSMGEGTIEKIRYLIEHNEHTWEVDVFEGENIGLVLAEIELNSEDEEFTLPEWIAKEVSDDSRYYNSNLQLTPYTKW